MPYLDFEAERESGGDSWERADPERALIEQSNPTTYLVTLPGGNTHTVSYGTERGGYVGHCDCKGWQYRDDDHSPCAHLATLRMAEAIGLFDIRGQRIKAESTLSEIEPGATETEPEIRADGSGDPDHYAAGADGEQFGTPESQL